MLLSGLFRAIEPFWPVVKLFAPVPVTIKGPVLAMAFAVALVVVTLKLPYILEAPKAILDAVPLRVTLAVVLVPLPTVLKLKGPL